MNREHANWTKVLAELESSFSGRFVPLQLPVGHALEFKGVCRLVDGDVSLGPDGERGAVPDDLAAEVESRREAVIEAAAESDDELIMKFLEGEELSPDEVRTGLMAVVKTGSCVPVFFTAATEALGVHALLDALIAVLPSPAEAAPRVATNQATGEEVELAADPAGPLVAQVFKTVADPYVGKLQYVRVFSGTLDADSRVQNVNHHEVERIGPVYVVSGKEQTTVGRVPVGDVGALAKLQHTQTADTLGDKDVPLAMPVVTYPQPLFSVALTPASQADSTKLGASLQKVIEEDPSLHSEYEAATRQLVLSGMGDAHVDVAVRRLADKFGVAVTTAVPKVPYRETITRSASAQYRHKKQTGGAGQFAEVHLRVEPRERGEGFEYGSKVFGGAISSQFVPSIEKGIIPVLSEGVIAGYPVVDIKAVVFDGKEHPVDSKDIAFQIAGREVFKLAVSQAGPVLLEPIYTVRVVVPYSQMGDVLGDLNTRRGMVQGTEQQGGKTIVTAQVPLAEMQRYSTDLRSMTQGRGYYTSEFSHFAVVPHQITDDIVARAQKEKEEEQG